MRPRMQLILTIGGFATWIVVVAAAWAAGAPLGHDESQYALAATDELAGAPARWYYLSRGMIPVAIPGIWLGGSEHALRLAPALLSIGFGAAMWAVGRQVTGAAAAALALLVLAGSRKIALYSSDLLSDFPSTACMLAALAVILGELERDTGVRWRIVWIGPLLAAAFYLRYGSVIPIAAIVASALLLAGRQLLRRPLPVVVTALVFVALLVPHFLLSRKIFGSSLGILLESRVVPQHAYAGEGLVTYLTNDPFRYYGLLVPFVLVAGVLALRFRDKKRLFVWLVAISSLVGLGFTTHAQVRYILLTLALLIVLGCGLLVELANALPRRARLAVAVIGIAMLVYPAYVVTRKHLESGAYRAHRMRGTLAATSAIKQDTAGSPCMVVGYHSTQLEWYSGCVVSLVMDSEAVAAAHARGDRVYIVRDYVPTWSEAPQPVLADFPGTPVMLLARASEVEVWRLIAP